jgi:hypothetical protein
VTVLPEPSTIAVVLPSALSPLNLAASPLTVTAHPRSNAANFRIAHVRRALLNGQPVLVLKNPLTTLQRELALAPASSSPHGLPLPNIAISIPPDTPVVLANRLPPSPLSPLLNGRAIFRPMAQYRLNL